jgi:hypothetical protein
LCLGITNRFVHRTAPMAGCHGSYPVNGYQDFGEWEERGHVVGSCGWLHSFSALDGGEWPALRPDRFTAENPPTPSPVDIESQPGWASEPNRTFWEKKSVGP